MSYENAPATRLLATHCACCGRPLVDAVSVEAGVGPDCRRQHGYGEQQGPANWLAAQHAIRSLAGGGLAVDPLPREWGVDAHAVANLLVHRIAAEQQGPNVNLLVRAVAALGYTRLAARVARRLATVRIEQQGSELIVRTPYDGKFVELVRRVPGRRWDREAKANCVPVTSRRELWSVLAECFEGATADGPKGLFVIGKAA